MRARPTRWIRASSAGTSFFNYQIDRFGAHEFHVGSRSVEVGVVGNNVSLLARDAQEDALRGASLMRGNHVLVAEDLLDGFFEMIEALAAGVTLVAFHDAGPLVSGHRAGAGVGEQIDQHIFGGKEEEIVKSGFEQFFALAASGPSDGFDALNPEWFDDGLDGHGF